MPVDGERPVDDLSVSMPDSGTPSATAEETPDPATFLLVARVMRSHGTQGELGCEIITDYPQRFRTTKRVFLSPPSAPGHFEAPAGHVPQPYTVKRARLAPHRGHAEVILDLEEVPDRDAADTMRGWLVQVPESEAWKLPRGRYYWHQIVGLRVITTEGEELGTVAQILETGANDVYVVKTDSGERLIPAIKQVVKKIAPERGEMIVSLIPGL